VVGSPRGLLPEATRPSICLAPYIEQREGRILRHSNLNGEVRIFRCVTESSFDAYMWQTLETKARFIQQVMNGRTSVRSADLDGGRIRASIE
jgi:hypothetical protein